MRVVRTNNGVPEQVVMAKASDAVARSTAALLNRQEEIRQRGISFTIENDADTTSPALKRDEYERT